MKRGQTMMRSQRAVQKPIQNRFKRSHAPPTNLQTFSLRLFPYPVSDDPRKSFTAHSHLGTRFFTHSTTLMSILSSVSGL